jgi:hypothetical protein
MKDSTLIAIDKAGRVVFLDLQLEEKKDKVPKIYNIEESSCYRNNPRTL